MRRNRYVSLSRGRSRRRRNGWKTAFVVLLIVAVLLTAVLLLSRNTAKPFSTVTPASSPIHTAVPTPAQTEDIPLIPPDEQTELPEGEEPQTQPQYSGRGNPVETLTAAYAESYAASSAACRTLLDKYSLKLMSFDMATALCHGRVMELRRLFGDMQQGEMVGTWESETAKIEASSGSYALRAQLADGGTVTGTVSSSVSRLTCTFTAADGTLTDIVELISANDGCYVQCWRPGSVYPNVRCLTASVGVHCAIDSTQQPALYDNVPVNWAAAAADSAQTIRYTEGGALVNMAGVETVYEK